MWTCPKCGSHVDSTFEICWSCGTTPDGVEDPDFVTADEAEPIYDPPLDLESKPGSAVEQELPEPPGEVVEFYQARNSAEAKFLVDQLGERGILAVANETHTANMEYIPNRFLPRLSVRAEDYARARSFVEEYEERKKSRGDEVEAS